MKRLLWFLSFDSNRLLFPSTLVSLSRGVRRRALCRCASSTATSLSVWLLDGDRFLGVPPRKVKRLCCSILHVFRLCLFLFWSILHVFWSVCLFDSISLWLSSTVYLGRSPPFERLTSGSCSSSCNILICLCCSILWVDYICCVWRWMDQFRFVFSSLFQFLVDCCLLVSVCWLHVLFLSLFRQMEGSNCFWFVVCVGSLNDEDNKPSSSTKGVQVSVTSFDWLSLCSVIVSRNWSCQNG